MKVVVRISGQYFDNFWVRCVIKFKHRRRKLSRKDLAKQFSFFPKITAAAVTEDVLDHIYESVSEMGSLADVRDQRPTLQVSCETVPFTVLWWLRTNQTFPIVGERGPLKGALWFFYVSYPEELIYSTFVVGNFSEDFACQDVSRNVYFPILTPKHGNKTVSRSLKCLYLSGSQMRTIPPPSRKWIAFFPPISREEKNRLSWIFLRRYLRNIALLSWYSEFQENDRKYE